MRRSRVLTAPIGAASVPMDRGAASLLLRKPTDLRIGVQGVPVADDQSQVRRPSGFGQGDLGPRLGCMAARPRLKEKSGSQCPSQDTYQCRLITRRGDDES